MISYLTTAVIFASFYALLALGLSIQWGTTGLVNFGHVAFFAIGAYTSGLLTLRGVPVVPAMVAGVILATVLGVLLACTTLRLRDDYLALVTLGFSELLRLFLLSEMWLTAGAIGLPGIPRLVSGFAGAYYDAFYFVLLLAVIAIFYLMIRRLDGAPFGRVLKAIREDEDVPRSAGKNVFAFKLQAFGLGAAIAGAAGALFSHYLTFIVPDQFLPVVTIHAWVAVILGGPGRHLGAIVGAFALMAVLEGTRFLKDYLEIIRGEQLAALRIIMVGIVLIGLMIYRPEGLFGQREGRR